MTSKQLLSALALATIALVPALALAHGVADSDRLFLEQSSGRQLAMFVYLGAKHMVTGYDHLLFLFGVIFFLHRMRDVATYVSLFAVGHSITLLYGVLSGTHVNPYIIDAIIGLSVVYKGLDNLEFFKTRMGFQPNTKAAVFLFGLIHGLGLATKLQDFELDKEGLVGNIIAFNVGVELGQFLALAVILVAMKAWRRTSSFARHSRHANVALVFAGLLLAGYQTMGYVQSADSASPPAQEAGPREDVITVTLAPEEGKEVKARMGAGDTVTYTWESDGAPIFFDFHGEEDGKPSSEFTSFSKGTSTGESGPFEAPFDGVHGWYWKNKGTGPATVTLRMSGLYEDLHELE